MFKTKFDSIAFAAQSLLQQGRIKKLCHAPTFLYLANKHYLEDSDIVEAFTEGGNDNGVDGVYIDRESDNFPTVYLIQSKFHTSEKAAQKSFAASGLDRVQRFFNILKDDLTPIEKVANPLLAEKIREIRKLQTRTATRFKIVLCSNSAPALEHQIRSAKLQLSVTNIQVENFHLEEMFEHCISNAVLNDRRVFSAIKDTVVEIDRKPISGAYGLISAFELHSFLKSRTNNKDIERGIFDLNVRGFLGLGGDINQDIIKSATSSENETFWAKNNGITIVANDGAIDASAVQPIVTLIGARVVNGAQTCSAIFQAITDLGANFKGIENLAIPFRIYFTSDNQLIEQISIATNSQNRINSRDLKANDPTQILIQDELAKRNIFYQRKRGISSEAGYDHTMDALRAGQIILSYIFGEPHRAKRDSNQIFESLYNRVFNNCDINALVEGFIVLQEIEAIASNEKLIEDILKDIDIDAGFLSYAQFHILSTAKRLSQASDDKATVEGYITEAIITIGRTLASKKRVSFYSFFRDPDSLRAIEQEIIQPDLFGQIRID